MYLNQNHFFKSLCSLMAIFYMGVIPTGVFASENMESAFAPVAVPSIDDSNAPLIASTSLTANAAPPADGETLTEIQLSTAFLKCTPASKAYVSDDCETVELMDGDVFIMAKKPMRIISKTIHLNLSKDSIVAISANDHVTKVHSLSIKPLSLTANGYAEKLGIGEEIVCADSLPALQAATQIDSIERRAAAVLHFEKCDDRILRCEYSPLSMMKTNHVFKEVFHSHQTDKRAIAQRLLKVAVALAYATASHGQYMQVSD